MATNRLRRALDRVQLALAPPGGEGLSDAQLLARFLTNRDEAAFAALVRRHGPMVLGVCRRVLRHAQDAEDAFQATFFVLARKAGSVLKGAALGSWLYKVAYRIAQKARAGRARRRAREVPVDELPQQVEPPAAPDWRPLLDEELSRLPEKYRAPVVLCDLQGQPRRRAALQLRLSDGTLSRNLAAGRRLLAQRLSRRGVALPAGPLAAALSPGAASAQLAGPLVGVTAKAAVLVAAGHLAAVAPPVAVLTKGVLRAMFLTKVKIALGIVLVVALGVGGLTYRPADAQTAQPPKRAEGKPLSELEVLRRENELLKLNLEVVLEKVRAQEAELRALRPAKAAAERSARDAEAARARAAAELSALEYARAVQLGGTKTKREELRADALHVLEAALKALREARDDAARRSAVDALDRAVRALREHLRKAQPDDPNKRPNEPPKNRYQSR
jgi:RNA polymerase sigma factor (sigma-70 family)